MHQSTIPKLCETDNEMLKGNKLAVALRHNASLFNLLKAVYDCRERR